MVEKTFEDEINVFNNLYKIDVSDRVEKKESGSKQLSYLSWAHAWAEAKKQYDIEYKIKEWDDKPYLYDENLGYMVMTSITIEGQTYEMWLPVMDFRNQAMKAVPYDLEFKSGKVTVNPATMMDINKTIMRCLVKNLAMFGLGLYIYAGEDIPENEDGKFIAPPMDAESAGDVRVTFGKYSGKKLSEIFAEDVGYITWLANESKSADIKNASNVLLDSVQNEDEVEPSGSRMNLGEFDKRLEKVAKLTNKDKEILDKFIFQEVSKEVGETVTELNDKVVPVYNKYLRLLESKANAKVREVEQSTEQGSLLDGNTTNPVDWGKQ